MSFILDALKKSEGERQRQSGPALFEVKVARPRSRFPAWAAALGALLVVNLGLLAWFGLRQAPGSPVANAATVPRNEPAATPPSPSRARAVRDDPVAAPSDSRPRLLEEPGVEEIADGGAEEPADGRLAEEPYAETIDQADYAPAEEPPAPPEHTGGRVTRGTDLGVPTYEQLASAPGQSLPELRLDLHVYADRPQDRFVFVNNRRLREGDALPDGIRVESIVTDGAVLSARGTRFLLQRQ